MAEAHTAFAIRRADKKTRPDSTSLPGREALGCESLAVCEIVARLPTVAYRGVPDDPRRGSLQQFESRGNVWSGDAGNSSAPEFPAAFPRSHFSVAFRAGDAVSAGHPQSKAVGMTFAFS
jgi:hypothetical protein